MSKIYYEQYGVGKTKYVVNVHDGLKTYEDGSIFYDIYIFKNKKVKDKFITQLKKDGYTSKY